MKKAVLYLFTFVFSFTLSIVGLTQVGVVKKRCFTLIQRNVDELTGFHISAGKFKMLGPFAFRFNDVRIKEQDNVASAQKIDVTINPLSLFRGKLECPYIFVDNLTVNEFIPVDVTGRAVVHPDISGSAQFDVSFDGTRVKFWDIIFDKKSMLGKYTHEGFSQGEGEFTYHFHTEKMKVRGEGMITNLPSFPHIEYGENLSVEYVVEGEIREPEIEIIVKEDALEISYLQFVDLELLTDLTFKGGGISVETELQGKLEEMPFRVQAKALWQGKELVKLENFSVEIPEASGTGEVLYDIENRVVQAHVNLVTAQLQETFPETDLDFLGHLIGRFSITSSLDENYFPVDPSIEVDFDSSGICVGEFSVKDLDLAFKMNGFSQIEGHLNADRINYQQESIESVACDFKLEEEVLSPLSLQGVYRGGKFEIATLVEWIDGELKCFLEKFKGVYLETPFETEPGGYLCFSDRGVLFNGIHLNYGGSAFNVQGSCFDDQFHLYSTSSKVSLEELSNSKISGVGQYELTLSGPLDSLGCKAALHVEGLNVENYPQEKLLPLAGDISIDLKESHLKLQGSLKGVGDEKIEVDATIPFQLSLFPFSFVVPFDEHIEGMLAIHGEISPFLGFLLSDTTSVTGNGHLEVGVNGTLVDPEFSGFLEVSDGTYESLVLGSIYHNIEGKLELEGNQIVVKHLEGIDSKGGDVVGEGFVVLDPEERYPFDIAIDITASQLLNLDYADCLANGKIHFKGTSDAGLIVGDLSVVGGKVRLPDETPALLNTIEVEYINQSQNERAPTMCIKDEDPWPVALDIRLNIPEGINVGAENWNSTWKGNLELRGSTDNPLIYGQGKIVQGEFLFNGKTLLSEEGAIYFSGEPGRKTTLYIIAREEVDDLKIEVIIKGPIKSPELAFRSNPPKTTREILSYLIFHRGLGDITPLEGEELTQHIIKLNDSVAEGPNLLDKLKTSFGIDRLDIEGEGDQDPDDVSLRVGKYLTRRFFLSLKKSMGDKPNQASIEADLTRNFKAQAEVGDDAQGKFILKWERDY